MRIQKKPAIPGWLFTVGMIFYCEMLLHIWIMDDFYPGRMAAVAAFALGFGCVLALAVALIPSPGASKALAMVLSTVVAVLWLTEYFVSDAYRVFMTPKLMLAGAGGVAQDYMDLILSLLARDFWRILLMLLPVVLYGICCRGRRTGWKPRCALAAGAVLCYLLGGMAVRYLTNDIRRFEETYNFDAAVRSFGLHMGLALDTVRDSAQAEEPVFVEVAAPAPTEPAETVPGETAPVEYPDNVIPALDFTALAESAGNSAVEALHRYVGSLTPSRQNEYTGLFRGKNLILITAEAFTAEVIDPELTPTLYRLANEGIRFQEYYQPAWGASTTSGEFSNLMSLVPVTDGMCMKEPMQQHMFLTMGYQLRNQGYYSLAYHNHNKDFYDRHKTHMHLGYEKFLALYGGLEGVKAVWPESDLEMIDVSVPQYIDNQPFSVYYMTVSGHSVYTYNGNAMTRKNYDKVAHLDYAETVKCYLAANLELEAAMASLVRQLEEAGIADDTVIVIASDHYPYGLERSGTWKNTVDYLKELYGVDDYDCFIRDHSQLIIWSGCIEDMDITVEEPVYSLDILPTVSNLFGVEYDSRLLVGRDVFSGEQPLVLWPDFSWITDKGTYDAKTGTFTPRDGVEVDDAYIQRINDTVYNKIYYSRGVQNTDYFNYLSKALSLQRPD